MGCQRFPPRCTAGWGGVGASREVSTSYVATVLTESLKSLQRENVPVENLREEHFVQVFDLVAEGSTAKESVVEVLRWLAAHPASTAADALDDLGLRMLSEQDLAVIVNKVVSSNQALPAHH